MAIAFFTRIPVPKWVDFASDKLKHASRYYSVVGFIIGLMTAGIFLLCNLAFSISVSVVLCTCFSVYLTGAFHEDGFADCCDGFGGGYSTEHKLAIMKDSRVGTYAVVGLVLILLLKWQLLVELDTHTVIALILGHTLSRMLAGSLIFSLPYVRSEDSKVRAYASYGDKNDLLILCMSAFLLLFIFLSFIQVLGFFALMFLMRVISILYLKRVLGGYTGDCLGAAQQITEIFVYLILLIKA